MTRVLAQFFGVLILATVAFCMAAWLSACAAKYTPEDRAGDVAGEATCEKLFAHESRDGGDAFDRALARGCVCAIGGNLARHDAGRLAGSVECSQTRK